MGIRFTFDNRAAVIEAMGKRIDTRMKAVGVMGKNDLKLAVSAKGNKTGKTPSLPGEDPAKVTGRLAASMTYNYDPSQKKLRIGTSLLYGKFLELGSNHPASHRTANLISTGKPPKGVNRFRAIKAHEVKAYVVLARPFLQNFMRRNLMRITAIVRGNR